MFFAHLLENGFTILACSLHTTKTTDLLCWHVLCTLLTKTDLLFWHVLCTLLRKRIYCFGMFFARFWENRFTVLACSLQTTEKTDFLFWHVLCTLLRKRIYCFGMFFAHCWENGLTVLACSRLNELCWENGFTFFACSFHTTEKTDNELSAIWICYIQ